MRKILLTGVAGGLLAALLIGRRQGRDDALNFRLATATRAMKATR